MQDRTLCSGRSVVEAKQNIALLNKVAGTNRNVFDNAAIAVVDDAQVAINGHLTADNNRADQIGICCPAEHGGDQKERHHKTGDHSPAYGIDCVLRCVVGFIVASHGGAPSQDVKSCEKSESRSGPLIQRSNSISPVSFSLRSSM